MLLNALLVACSASPTTNPRDAADANDTGRRLAPKGEDERLLLTQVAALPSGGAKRIGAYTVVADAPYPAASGRTCRALRITSGANQRATQRLACSFGAAWFFVPDVFGSNAPSE